MYKINLWAVPFSQKENVHMEIIVDNIQKRQRGNLHNNLHLGSYHNTNNFKVIKSIFIFKASYNRKLRILTVPYDIREHDLSKLMTLI